MSAQLVNNISESAIGNSSKPIKFPHLRKLDNQSTLNKGHVIEITKACKVAFMKARDSFVGLYREERVIWEKKKQKKQDDKNLLFKISS